MDVSVAMITERTCKLSKLRVPRFKPFVAIFSIIIVVIIININNYIQLVPFQFMFQAKVI